MDNSVGAMYTNLVNKIFGKNIEKYFKIVNIAVVVILITVLHYIYSFDTNNPRYNDKILLYMYYGFLFCLAGFTISVNWIFYEYTKNKKKNNTSIEQKTDDKKNE